MYHPVTKTLSNLSIAILVARSLAEATPTGLLTQTKPPFESNFNTYISSPPLDQKVSATAGLGSKSTSPKHEPTTYTAPSMSLVTAVPTSAVREPKDFAHLNSPAVSNLATNASKYPFELRLETPVSGSKSTVP